jgi:hypothetical protein
MMRRIQMFKHNFELDSVGTSHRFRLAVTRFHQTLFFVAVCRTRGQLPISQRQFEGQTETKNKERERDGNTYDCDHVPFRLPHDANDRKNELDSDRDRACDRHEHHGAMPSLQERTRQGQRRKAAISWLTLYQERNQRMNEKCETKCDESELANGKLRFK